MPRTTNKANGVINFYEHKDIQKLLPQYHNPHFNETQISLPFRMGIIGNSGSRKTSTLLTYIARANDTFGHIHVCAKMPDEPLYQFLQQKLKGKNITFYSKLSELPLPNDMPHKDKQQLLVFDDMVNEKNQEIVNEFFIRARKVGMGISCIYISQSYFKIPRTTRLQFSYLLLLKLSSIRDLNMVMADYNLGLSKDEIKYIYRDATKVAGDFLKIDINTADNNKRFSHNWTDFYKVEKESDSDGE